MTKDDFYSHALIFLENLFHQLHDKNVELQSHWNLDHLCFRVNSVERYRHFFKAFHEWSDLLIETEVNGRPISTFNLHVPLNFRGRQIDLVELPAPKAGKIMQEGFEHIEVVCDVSFQEIKHRFSQCAFNESGLNKQFNQELELCLNNCSVKFHHLSLESVICLEKNQKVFSAIIESRVLETLKSYYPLIAGTFPLGLQGPQSDADIILTASDLVKLEGIIKNQYGHFEGFKIHIADIGGEESLIANFFFKEIPFELFAQKLPSVRQHAYRHFLIEERLLKLGGQSLHQQIIHSRKQGLKTEAAFAKVLGLKGNPYEELLKLQKLSDKELLNFI